jgi:hypothetical protein
MLDIGADVLSQRAFRDVFEAVFNRRQRQRGSSAAEDVGALGGSATTISFVDITRRPQGGSAQGPSFASDETF